MPLSQEEINAEVAKQKEDRDRVERIKGLLLQPGWSDFQDLMNSQIGIRSAGIWEPLQSNHDSLRQEHNKGVVYGLIMSRDLLGVIVAAQREAPASEDSDE